MAAHKLQTGKHVEVEHPTNGARVFVWNVGAVLRVSIIGPVYPQLDVHADRVEVIEDSDTFEAEDSEED